MNSSKVTSPSPLSLVNLEVSYAIPSWVCYGLLVRDYRTPPKQGTAYEPHGGDRLLGLGFSGCLSFSMLCFAWKDSIFVHMQINTHRLNMYEELENSRSLCFKRVERQGSTITITTIITDTSTTSNTISFRSTIPMATASIIAVAVCHFDSYFKVTGLHLHPYASIWELQKI